MTPIVQDGSEFLQLVAADWLEDKGQSLLADALRANTLESPSDTDWCWELRRRHVGGSIVGGPGGVGSSGAYVGGGVGGGPGGVGSSGAGGAYVGGGVGSGRGVVGGAGVGFCGG